MIKINQITGNKIKKLTGAERVRKSYHNKHKRGSGNFGFVVVFPNNDWYRIDGDYGVDGVVYNLRVNTYGSRDMFNENQTKRIELIKKALYDISVGKI